MHEKTYYEILNLPPVAEESEIKTAYRELSRLHHPDMGGDPAVFAKILRAYETLRDPGSRAAYDTILMFTMDPCSRCVGLGVTYKQHGFLNRTKELCSVCGGRGLYHRRER